MAPSLRKNDRIRPKKQPTQERAIATVEALLQATAYILVHDGYDSLTTNKVAERAGVNVASLYQYFPHKDALVAELQRRHILQARAAAAAVVHAHVTSGKTGLKALVRMLVRCAIAEHAQSPELHRVFAEELPRRVRVVDDLDLRQQQALWRDQFKLDVPDVELATWMVQTAAHAVVHEAAVNRPALLQSELFADELALLMVRFLKR